jgi:hypothetical protein
MLDGKALFGQETIRLKWFGGFTVRKVVGLAFMSLLAFIFKKTFAPAYGIVLLMMATAFIDGVTVIDIKQRSIRRTVRFFYLIPLWSKRTNLQMYGELLLTFRPSWIDKWNNYHFRDFTILDLRFGPKQWIQLIQNDQSRNNFEPMVLSQARQLSKLLKVSLVLKVDYVSGAVKHMDDTKSNPPPELKIAQ